MDMKKVSGEQSTIFFYCPAKTNGNLQKPIPGVPLCLFPVFEKNLCTKKHGHRLDKKKKKIVQPDIDISLISMIGVG